MAMPSQLARAITLLMSCILVTGTGLLVVNMTPGGTDRTNLGHPGAPRDAVPGRSFVPRQPVALGREQLPPPPAVAESPRAQFARFDKIVVQVSGDGALRVLGEPMAMDAFKSLLYEQSGDSLQKVVAIFPDQNCPFRYVGPIISICQEAGIPHRTEPGPIQTSGEWAPGGPV